MGVLPTVQYRQDSPQFKFDFFKPANIIQGEQLANIYLEH